MELRKGALQGKGSGLASPRRKAAEAGDPLQATEIHPELYRQRGLKPSQRAHVGSCRLILNPLWLLLAYWALAQLP